MTNKNNWLGILVMVLVLGMTVLGCDNDQNETVNQSQTVKYESKDSTGNTYTLIITENLNRAVYSAQSGDNYELKIELLSGTLNISRGTVQFNIDGNLTLKPSIGDAFNVTISAGKMTGLSGTITLIGGQTESAPSGNLIPINDPGLNGIWVYESSNVELKLYNGNWERSYGDGAFIEGAFNKGTFTVSGDIFTMITTHFHGGKVGKDAFIQVTNGLVFEDKWYSKNDLFSWNELRNALSYLTNSEFEEWCSNYWEFQTIEYQYLLNGNILSLVYDYGPEPDDWKEMEDLGMVGPWVRYGTTILTRK